MFLSSSLFNIKDLDSGSLAMSCHERLTPGDSGDPGSGCAVS